MKTGTDIRGLPILKGHMEQKGLPDRNVSEMRKTEKDYDVLEAKWMK